MDEVLNQVKEYYGKIINKKQNLKTSACCTNESLPASHLEILRDIEPEIIEKFYGCGSPIPPLLEGSTVLDLGCGTGRDVYLVSRLVGQKGKVIGVDMTEEQISVARKYLYPQMEKAGYHTPNVEFHQGYIEDLESTGIANNSIDVVISNCVINLSPAKDQVFKEIIRVLKPGGELYFSDVFAGCRVPEELKNNPILYGECLSGALYIEDFRRIIRRVGILDYRLVSKRALSLDNPEVETIAGMIDFYSMTVRAFKLNTLEDICEDYGQIATYHGTIPDNPHNFQLDDHHIFVSGKPVLVCGNTAAMLQETRFSKHFTIQGDRSKHYGPFDCHPQLSINNDSGENNIGGACC